MLKMFKRISGASGHSATRLGELSGSALGDHWRDQGQWGRAVEAYQTHLATHPADFAIQVQLGNCAKESADYLTSLTAYQTAQQLRPDDADLRLQLGHLLKVMGRKREARDAYLAAFRFDPALTDARREAEGLQHLEEGQDFALPITALDVVKAVSMEDLVAQVKANAALPDPFQAYRALIEG